MTRNSIPLDIVDAMVRVLRAHAWETVTPSIVLDGPISAGHAQYPCIAVMSSDGIGNDEHSNHLYADVTEEVTWVIAQSLTTAPLVDQWKQHVEWRCEAVRLARRAVDRYWGLEQNIRGSLVTGWEPSLVRLGDGQSGLVANLLSTTITLEVSYREAIDA